MVDSQDLCDQLIVFSGCDNTNALRIADNMLVGKDMTVLCDEKAGAVTRATLHKDCGFLDGFRLFQKGCAGKRQCIQLDVFIGIVDEGASVAFSIAAPIGRLDPACKQIIKILICSEIVRCHFECSIHQKD